MLSTSNLTLDRYNCLNTFMNTSHAWLKVSYVGKGHNNRLTTRFRNIFLIVETDRKNYGFLSCSRTL